MTQSIPVTAACLLRSPTGAASSPSPTHLTGAGMAAGPVADRQTYVEQSQLGLLPLSSQILSCSAGKDEHVPLLSIPQHRRQDVLRNPQAKGQLDGDPTS